MLRGVAASAGIGLGKAVVYHQEDLVAEKRPTSDVYREQHRFYRAVERYCGEALQIFELARKRIGNDVASIITAQMALVNDPELHGEVIALMQRERVVIEYAFAMVCDKYIRLFSMMENDMMRSRAADFLDIKNCVLEILLHKRRVDITQIPANTVLVTEDMPPSQAITLDPNQICALVTQSGNPYSHMAIIAQTLGLPLVVVENAMNSIRDGDDLIVDGNGGWILQNPSFVEHRRYLNQLKSQRILA